ncbi:MAG TPA: zinc ribbon domain-containing protein [Anaerolineae bacterium]|nr:zinc ribbon domain-containing protein [Anaerolineae bacterium]
MSTPCPRCGTVNQPNARYCKQCGLTLAATTDPLTIPKPQASQQPAASAQPAPSGKTIRCPNCGTLNRANARFCNNCRAQLAPNAPAPSPTPVPAVPQAPPATPQSPPSATAVLPPTQQRARGFRWLAIIPPIILGLLALMLCGSLFGVYNYESHIPTPTAVAALPTETPVPTDTAEPTDTPLPPTPTPTIPPSPTPITPQPLPPTPPPDPPNPIVQMHIAPDGRFGFSTTIGDPTNSLDDNKPLTYRKENSDDPADGHTNSLLVWVDGDTPGFGSAGGNWTTPPTVTADGSAMQASWEYKQIIFSEKIAVVVNPTTNRLGIFRIEYQAENTDSVAHDVGLRLMLDTLIGNDDGVPFILPNQTGVVTAPLDLSGAQIPDSFKVFEPNDPEHPDINNAGVIAQFTLAGEDATRPDRLLLSSWCHVDWAWDYLQQVGGNGPDFTQCQGKGPHDDKKDSAVGLFWNAQPLNAGEIRTWVVYYGLGEFQQPTITSNLRLDQIAPQYNVGDQFYVTALIQNPSAEQSVRIEVPHEFTILDSALEQPVTQAGLAFTQVSWRLRAETPVNDAQIRVTLLPDNTMQTLTTSVVILPTPTPTLSRTPRPTRTPRATSTPTLTPTPCATTVTQPSCP